MKSNYYERCDYNLKPGWKCSRLWGHEGPCALKPKWWNLSQDARAYRRVMRK